jgi:hypothetical protein
LNNHISDTHHVTYENFTFHFTALFYQILLTTVPHPNVDLRAEVGSTAREQLSHLVTAYLEKYLALSKAKIRIVEATGHFK